jgi:hypothetical protein
MHWPPSIYSIFLILAFTLGLLTEGKHQCATDSGRAAETHAEHLGGPASDQQSTHDCDCLSHCCSLSPATWTPQQPMIVTGADVAIDPGVTGTSQYIPTPQRYLLPLALAPPLAG